MDALQAHLEAQSADFAKLGIRMSFTDEEFFERARNFTEMRDVPSGTPILPGGMIVLTYRYVSIALNAAANGYYGRASVPAKPPHLQGAGAGFLADLAQVDQFIVNVIRDVDVGKTRPPDPPGRSLRW